MWHQALFMLSESCSHTANLLDHDVGQVHKIVGATVGAKETLARSRMIQSDDKGVGARRNVI